jgi:hypothetical protein
MLRLHLQVLPAERRDMGQGVCEIRPMLEATPGLRPVTPLEEMQRRYPIMTGIACAAA